jgi:hypothetical protein
MMLRLIRQENQNFSDTGVSCGWSSWYILQTSADQGEHWETVPVLLFHNLPRDEQDKIIRDVTPPEPKI